MHDNLPPGVTDADIDFQLGFVEEELEEEEYTGEEDEILENTTTMEEKLAELI